jgi:hypothetical protein
MIMSGRRPSSGCFHRSDYFWLNQDAVGELIGTPFVIGAIIRPLQIDRAPVQPIADVRQLMRERVRQCWRRLTHVEKNGGRRR